MKTRRMGAELFHRKGRTDGQTDRQTDMTKLIVVFRNFAKAPASVLTVSVSYTPVWLQTNLPTKLRHIHSCQTPPLFFKMEL